MTRQNVVQLVPSEPAPSPHDPRRRGYSALYEGPHTRCPGCSRSNWYVGRFSAECAFDRCWTAIPLGGGR